MLLQSFIRLLHPWKCFTYVQLVDGVDVVDELLGFGLLDQDVGQDIFLIQVGDDEGGHGGAVVSENLEIFVFFEFVDWNSGQSGHQFLGFGVLSEHPTMSTWKSVSN